jgi:hypothetical protein
VAPAGNLLDRLERSAWAIPLPTRRLFGLLAWLTAGVLVAGSLAGAVVTTRNAATIDRARDQGLGIARSATTFRTELATADAVAAGTLIDGGLESPQSRASYDRHLLQASRALTNAGLVAADDDREDVTALADGLVRYAGLVESARANSRLGYPLGAAYLGQARRLANDDLVPRAERLRRVGEQRVARAANTVGGPGVTAALALLVFGVLLTLAAGAVLAGRTRRVLQPALAVAALVAVMVTAMVAGNVDRQSSRLRRAATADISRLIAANDASSALANLRVTEIGAVAAHGSGAALYDEFHQDARELTHRLAGDDAQIGAGLRLAAYTDAVARVRARDEKGDNAAAAASTLSGPSSSAYAVVQGQAARQVTEASDALAVRIGQARRDRLPPLLPLALGLAAALAAAVGVLARGRRYR